MGAGADDYLIKPVAAFAVQTRLVAAKRVTDLHRQVADFRAQLEQANLELLDRSLTDALTGLGNRRRMDADLARAHAWALRVGRGYAVTMFDIDHFKLYNDHYGHPAGDEILRQVGRCLEQTVRAGERIYRYGGEEFLLLMTDCSVGDANTAALRVREAVADMAIPHEARPSAPPMVTVSGGVSYWASEPDVSVSELLQRADEALYLAKSAGRNQVHVTPTQLLTEMSMTKS
jgi:two-component system chemotaxis response regulator CheY